jgi:hypothetical protein
MNAQGTGSKKLVINEQKLCQPCCHAEVVRGGSQQLMKPKRGLAQAAFPAPWPIAAVIVMLIGIRWAIAQESINFQDRNKAIDAGVLSVINTEARYPGMKCSRPQRSGWPRIWQHVTCSITLIVGTAA